jgi:hypothetical protein
MSFPLLCMAKKTKRLQRPVKKRRLVEANRRLCFTRPIRRGVARLYCCLRHTRILHPLVLTVLPPKPLPVMGVKPAISWGLQLFYMKGAPPRHCERSEAIHCGDYPVWIASGFALAMTTFPATPLVLSRLLASIQT